MVHMRGVTALLSILELALLALVVYLVLGPERLPEVMHFLGRVAGEARGMVTALMADLSAPVREGQEGRRDAAPQPDPPDGAVPAHPWSTREVMDEAEEETGARGR